MSQDGLEEIKRRLDVVEKRVAKQERSHGRLVAVLTVVLVAIVLFVLILWGYHY